MSAVLLMPVTLLAEGFQLSASNMTAMGILDPSALLMKAILTGLFFHLYQQVSYMILSRVSPVTHSIGNCVKRVVVIVSSVIVFQTTVTTQNAIGTTIALLGVFAYSQVTRKDSKKKSNTK
jgi:solute carrier family 35 protein E1